MSFGEHTALRLDGRTAFDLRSPSVKFSFVSKANGSSLVWLGHSSVSSVVVGPKAATASTKMLLDRAYVDVVVLPQAGVASNYEKLLEFHLLKFAQSCIHLRNYPMTVIRIAIQILQFDGASGSVAVNAMIFALLDAGIQLRFTPFAICVGIVRSALVDEKDITTANAPLKHQQLDGIVTGEGTTSNSQSPLTEFAVDVEGKIQTQDARFVLDPTEREARELCESVVCFVFNYHTGGFISSFMEQGGGFTEGRSFLYALAFTAIKSLGQTFRKLWEKNTENIMQLFNANNEFYSKA